jgi:hypothetical protein
MISVHTWEDPTGPSLASMEKFVPSSPPDVGEWEPLRSIDRITGARSPLRDDESLECDNGYGA